jgi:hypothetical protein
MDSISEEYGLMPCRPEDAREWRRLELLESRGIEGSRSAAAGVVGLACVSSHSS